MSRGEGFLLVDPLEVYFTHARVRPFFSGCGRRLEDTLGELLDGRMRVEDLPVITILYGAGGGTIYFSLNNRRLWVLKELRKAGALENNTVRVRTKEALPREKERYTPIKCSLTATIMGPSEHKEDEDGEEGGDKALKKKAAHAPVPAPVPVWHPTVGKALKQLQSKMKIGGARAERDAQSRIDDWIDAGILPKADEDALWTCIRS
jgi:hypothetical protein